MPRTSYHEAMSRVAWTDRLAELRQFKSVHGHCNVPRGYEDNPSLGRWVNKQRGHYKHMQQGIHSPMTKERIKILEKEGFQWEIRNRGGRSKRSGSRSNLRGAKTKSSKRNKSKPKSVAAAPAEEDDSDDEDEDGQCSGCQGARDVQAAAAEEPILLCDGCDREYHLGCVDPPLTEVPEGDFYCGACEEDEEEDDGDDDDDDDGITASSSSSSGKQSKGMGGSTSATNSKSYSGSSASAAAQMDQDEDQCCGCHGARDKEAADEPVLLCDGLDCDREYHLGCVDPPLTEVPEGNFFCSDCVHDGTSAHLAAYLDQSEERSADFRSSKQYVHHLLRKQMKNVLEAEEEVEASKPMDELVATEGRAPKRARKSPSSQDGAEGSSSKSDELSHWPERERPPQSELFRISELYAAIMEDIDRATGTASATDTTTTTTTTTSTPMDEFTNDTTSITGDTNKIGPDFFVGKPITVYCPLDNSYHNGRIVDWRVSSRGHPEYHGDDKIASAEFLVRFPPGINGRRKGLHRWIILEEHSVTISLAIVFALFKKGRGLSGWKPAQIMVRSSLELIPIRRLLIDDGEERGLAFFFGEATHAYLKLRDQATDFLSPLFSAQRGEKVEASPPAAAATGGSSSAKAVGGTIATDAHKQVALLLAFLERDEQQRVNNWGRMPLLNPSHEKALTAVDEYALDPVAMPSFGHDMNQSEEVDQSADTIKQAESADAKDHGLVAAGAKLPICLQVERGIDRRWLAHLANGENVRIEQNLHVMQGLSVKPVACMPSAMARLQKQRKCSAPATARSPTAASRRTLGNAEGERQNYFKTA